MCLGACNQKRFRLERHADELLSFVNYHRLYLSDFYPAILGEMFLAHGGLKHFKRKELDGKLLSAQAISLFYRRLIN